jgi:hypothetical protein
MPTAVRSAPISATLPSNKVSNRQSDFNNFALIVLFSGIGLLVSLIAVLSGVPGVWF